MCNKKERKRDRRWYLFPVFTLGAYFAVHGGTGRFVLFFEAGRDGFFLFPKRDGAGFFFPRRDGVAFFFFSTGRDGAVFFFLFEGRDGTVVFGGGNCFGGTGQNRHTVPPKEV